MVASPRHPKAHVSSVHFRKSRQHTDLLGTMQSHSFVQLAQGIGANGWWECPDWTLVSILCISITANEKGKVKTKPQLHTLGVCPHSPRITSSPHLTAILLQAFRLSPIPEKTLKRNHFSLYYTYRASKRSELSTTSCFQITTSSL